MTIEEEILGYFDIWDEFNDSGKFTITKYFFLFTLKYPVTQKP